MSEFLPLLKVGRDMDEGGFDYQITTNPITPKEYREIVLMTHWALVNLRDYIVPPSPHAASMKGDKP